MNRYTPRCVMLCVAVAAALAGCGGGSEEPVLQAGPDRTEPAAFVQASVVGDEFCDAAALANGTFQQVDGRCVRASTVLGQRPVGAPQAMSGTPTITAAMFMDWAETAFPQFFGPAVQPTQTNGALAFRFYPGTQNFLAVLDGGVYALGPITGNQVVRLGTLGDFACAVTQRCVPPGAPTIVSATPAHSTAIIVFIPAADHGPLDRYQAHCTGSGTAQRLNFVVSTMTFQSPIVVWELANGREYSCRVNASNGFGTGPLSEPVKVTPVAMYEPKITSINEGDGRVTFSFTPPPANVPYDRYVAACTLDHISGSYIKATSTSSPITVTGLKNGATYFCDLHGENIYGSGLPTMSYAVYPRSPTR